MERASLHPRPRESRIRGLEWDETGQMEDGSQEGRMGEKKVNGARDGNWVEN